MGVLNNPLKGNNYMTGEELEKGVTVKLVSAKAINLPEDKAKKYGAKEEDALVKKGFLTLGQTMQYEFMRFDSDFNEWEHSVFENKSIGFYIALSNIDPEPDTVFTIKREGEGTATKYFMKINEA